MNIENNNFDCPVCKNTLCSPLIEQTVAHPLWWLDGKPEKMILRYVICEECSHIMLHPHLSPQEYDEIYRLTPGLDSKVLSEDRKKMLMDRKHFILKHANGLGKDILIEAGPAYGDFLMMFDFFKHRIGIEPSLTYREFVERERPELDYYPCLMEHFIQANPEYKEKADLVTACHVLEHSFDPAAFVDDLSKLITKGGYLYIEVPSIEGMALTEAPLYQNLYFGHVSQFSIPVITRLGIQSGLDPVCIEYSISRNYPVVRSLFKKNKGVEEIRAFFLTHSQNIRKMTEKADNILVSFLSDESKNHIMIWGCGQDLMDIILTLKGRDLQLYRQKVLLVDRNPDKQGKFFLGVEIQDPEVFIDEQIDMIIIPSRSQLLRIDIGQDALKLFPSAEIIYPYDIE